MKQILKGIFSLMEQAHHFYSVLHAVGTYQCRYRYVFKHAIRHTLSYCYFTLILLLSTSSYGQSVQDSTVQDIAPVRIRSYFSSQAFLKHTSSAKVVTREQMEAQMPGTILPAMNTTPGVRMEERSPGSYRLALRGSMLRSPFGVRNTKMYLDEIPFTDAGGNTYLSSLDPVGLQQVTIIKGPDGSLFGPNSGGVVRITPFGLDSIDPTTKVLLSGGSFGTFNQQLSHRQQVSENYQFSFDQGFMRSDGYRDHTDMNRTYLQTGHRWRYTPKGTLKFLGIYSDLYYSNPGGLTLEQFNMNPRMARPPAGPNRGAAEQGASVRNRMLLGGIVHEYRFSDKWAHSISVFGNYTDVNNPLVTNLERRYEKNVGFRTYLSYNDSVGDILSWQMQAGMEVQRGDYQIDYFDNNFGVPGNMQSIDDMTYGQQAYFYRASATLADRLTAEASIGLNFNDIESVQRFSTLNIRQPVDIHFTPAWMPRVALSYTISHELAIRSSVSRGYSPPALSEVLSSDNILSPDLRAESGYNYEIGLRSEIQNRRWLFDVSAYQYRLNNGIVRQLNEDGTEFFVNSGTIDQRGVELLVMGQLIPRNKTMFIRGMHVSTALTFQDYTFRSYRIVEENQTFDYSGNQVTSIPRWMSVNAVHIQMPYQLGLNIMHNYLSAIPLNDANTTHANSFHLVQAKAHWKLPLPYAKNIQLFVGADNILNKTYSLGNDINAFGGRFFNAAPTRNYYGGLSVEW